MKRILVISASLVTLLLPAAAAGTGGSFPSVYTATVKHRAVVVSYEGTNAQTAFLFNVYNCPEGNIITIDWTAEQPRPSTSQSGTSEYVFSTGDRVQQLLHSSTGGFRPGYNWVGSGTVTCGLLVDPVSGSGPTLPVAGVAVSYDDD